MSFRNPVCKWLNTWNLQRNVFLRIFDRTNGDLLLALMERLKLSKWNIFDSETWGCHSSDDQNLIILGRYALWSGTELPIFRRSVMLSLQIQAVQTDLLGLLDYLPVNTTKHPRRLGSADQLALSY
jgi:hypothetical protein